MTTLADIFELPDRVHQGDFVLRLAEGVERSDQTLRDYVVTPQLVHCFGATLDLIGGAVRAGASKGAYLHGSFGSGKSHFMAVLTLLLQGDVRARSIPELAEVVAKANEWTTNRRFLVVPYHMIGATSMESAILGHYAEHVRRVHPQAPTPGFFQAHHLFRDAGALRDAMGDAAFFAQLNAAARGGDAADDAGWGALASEWDGDSFEAAQAAAPGNPERAGLIGDLIDAFFSALRASDGVGDERYASLDEGLAVMSRHAQTLGYDAVVLFLDELILWLASHAADSAFLHREGQKVAKLVEAARADRPIPIVSFIARQRDLRELVGEHLPGAQQLGFADVLNWWEARFDRITLEDRNLPAIVERRVLRPKNDAARAELDAAFERTARVRHEVMSVLLTKQGDREMFRQVYPFTPALVQALIAVSSLLQRERTALKLMLQLLVDQAARLRVGDVIPVGDLFDVIAEGDEPFTQAMRLRFEDARKLYRTKLRPLLEGEHGAAADPDRSGETDEAAVARYRNDDRLLKTLLLSAIADGVEALRALTPARLAALNHGTVRSPIPGQESQIVLQKCRQWAAHVGEIKVADDGANPIISLQIVGVDTESILQNAGALDNVGNRIRAVRQMLMEDFGITETDGLLPQRHDLVWRGTRRACDIVFRNVREMGVTDLRNDGPSWQVVIDWPFDDPGYTPADDRARIQQFLQSEESTQTLVWLPAFFTSAAQGDLGRLVLLEAVLTGNRLAEHGAHLSEADREQARALLTNQRDQMRQRIRNGLLMAYGVSDVAAGAVEAGHELEGRFVSLSQECSLRPPVAATLRQALDVLFGQALAAQYPDHPEFGAEVKRPAVRRVLEVVREAVAHPEQRVEVRRQAREEVRNVVIPLALGDMGETHFKLGRRWLDELDRKRAQRSADSLTVADLRAWIEEPERRGLPSDLQNLVIVTYALQKGYRFTLQGIPLAETVEKLDDRCALQEQELPARDVYERARDIAHDMLGVSASAVLSASSVSAMAQNVRDTASDHRGHVDELSTALRRRLESRGLVADDGDRMRTVAAAQGLLSALAGTEDEETVAVLAAVEAPTSTVAMAAVVQDARSLSDALAAQRWAVFDRLAVLPERYRQRIEEVDQSLNDALHRDEHAIPLLATLQQCETRALDLLAEAATSRPEPPKPPPATRGGVELSGSRDVAAADVTDILADIGAAVRTSGATRVAVDWRVYSDTSDTA